MPSSRKQGLEAAASEIKGDHRHVPRPRRPGRRCRGLRRRHHRGLEGLDILSTTPGQPYYRRHDGGRRGSATTRRSRSTCAAPVFWSAQAVAKAMNDKPGVIMNIASVGGLRSYGLGVYYVTIGGADPLTRQLAGELGPTRVVVIAPGLVKTDFTAYSSSTSVTTSPAHADRAAGRARGHRQPRRVPRQRQGKLDHRRDLRHRRRRWRVPDPLSPRRGGSCRGRCGGMASTITRRRGAPSTPAAAPSPWRGSPPGGGAGAATTTATTA